MNAKPIVTKTTIVHENPYYKIRKDDLTFPNGHHGAYWVIDKPDGCGVIAECNGTFCMISQFRHPVQKVMYEFPSGAATSSDYVESAKRELREETGLIATDLQHLISVVLAEGHASFQTHFYYTKVEKSSNQHERDLEEYDLQTHWFSAEEIDAMILNKEIISSQTIAAWLYFRMSPVWTASKAEPGIALS